MTSVAVARPRVRLLGGALFGLVAFAIACGGAKSGTEVTYNEADCTFTFVIRIAYYGDGADSTQIAGWESAVENFWNGQNLSIGACPLKVDVQSLMVGSKGDCPDDHHSLHRSEEDTARRLPPLGAEPPARVEQRRR